MCGKKLIYYALLKILDPANLDLQKTITRFAKYKYKYKCVQKKNY